MHVLTTLIAIDEVEFGWHLLRNPGQFDLNAGRGRHKKEAEFFPKNAPWKSLDKENLGVQTLRVRLQAILEDHIRREFPKVGQKVSLRCPTTLMN